MQINAVHLRKVLPKLTFGFLHATVGARQDAVGFRPNEAPLLQSRRPHWSTVLVSGLVSTSRPELPECLTGPPSSPSVPLWAALDISLRAGAVPPEFFSGRHSAGPATVLRAGPASSRQFRPQRRWRCSLLGEQVKQRDGCASILLGPTFVDQRFQHRPLVVIQDNKSAFLCHSTEIGIVIKL
jgi:hypothetical protein